MTVDLQLDPPLSEAQRRPADFPPPWAVAWGDDRYGLWAELAVQGVVQRLRWIEPGSFWMGSPDDEPGRSDNESPRHLVRLTAGFWLADTTCSQALWLAVLGGENPSRYQTDPGLPVEQVSWDDVQGFLQKLQAQATEGCDAALPSEAEWEYACRAGSTTAFNTGEALAETQANFGLAERLGFSKAVEAEDATLPARHFRPNRWGLYQMHGNVWEWCADDRRDYAKAARGDDGVEDPARPQEQGPEAPRAVRGGSWINPARNARSAYRKHKQRGNRNHNLGFRLALRSTSPVRAR